MKHTIALLCALTLAGCAGGQFTSDQEAAILCRSYAATLSVLAAYRHRMTDPQVSAVEQARSVLTPACGAAQLSGAGFGAADLARLRDHLRALLVLEQEAKGRSA